MLDIPAILKLNTALASPKAAKGGTNLADVTTAIPAKLDTWALSAPLSPPPHLHVLPLFSLSLSSPSVLGSHRGQLVVQALDEMPALRAAGFGGAEGNGVAWWDEIDGSEEWQRGIYYTLCGACSIVALVALVQLIRIQLRVPEYGWTTQKLFHLMNFVVNGLRAILFGFYHSVFFLQPRVLEIVLLDLPSLLFFSTYTLLVLFWAEIYHQARSLPIDKLRPAYLTINGAVYVIQVGIWVYMEFSPKPIAVEIAKLFLAVISFVAALGFLIYGGRLFIMLRRFPIESKGRQKKLNEVGFVTAICSTCFLIRCFVVALSAFDKDADIDVLDHPILNFIYYMLVEILPSALVLFILRKLPPKRVTEQYHPIN